ASQAAAGQASAAASEGRESLPRVAYGTPYGAQPSRSPSATPSPSVSGSASPSATPSPSSSAAATAKAGPCPAGNAVLSLFTSQPSYRSGQQPKFNVYAVSTSASACQLKYGSAAVRVVVTRQGKVIWDSAACKTTQGSAGMVSMAPGVPQEVSLAWN